MNVWKLRAGLSLALLVTLYLSTASNSAAQTTAPVEDLPPPASIADEVTGETDDYRPMEQGPIHEAFAAPLSSPSDQQRLLVDREPPPPVNEKPPERPATEKPVTWIGGYWAWEPEQEEFVWVSGLWRYVPPGRSWKPGSWAEVDGKYKWNPGFWQGESTSAAERLPPPPASIDNGPSVPPPSDQHFWVPGHWAHTSDDYVWQSGFWSRQPDHWVWQPACYVASSGGYVFVDGYWDYVPTSRGYLYSSVRFVRPVYLQPQFIYRPRYPLIRTASLLTRLFFRVGYPYYFYGDYYGPNYFRSGYRPWFDPGRGYRYSVPLIAYYDARYRSRGIDFTRSMQRYGNELQRDVQRRNRSDFDRGGRPARSLDQAIRQSVVATTSASRARSLRQGNGSLRQGNGSLRQGNASLRSGGASRGLNGSPARGNLDRPRGSVRRFETDVSRPGSLPGVSRGRAQVEPRARSFNERGNRLSDARQGVPSINRGRSFSSPATRSPEFGARRGPGNVGRSSISAPSIRQPSIGRPSGARSGLSQPAVRGRPEIGRSGGRGLQRGGGRSRGGGGFSRGGGGGRDFGGRGGGGGGRGGGRGRGGR